jgi:hypothetical protein
MSESFDYTPQDRELMGVLIDVQRKAIGILTALRRVKAIMGAA